VFALVSLLSRFVGAFALTTLLASGSAPSVRGSGNPPRGAVGGDVGAQSCSQPMPTGASFGVIAATDGRPYFASPCLSTEYAWANGLPYRAQYYINLADPGHRSSHWNHGGPRACDPKPKYDVGCAYDYGYEAAATAWGYVAAVGTPGNARWWLDVETDNTWGYSSSGIAANRSVIRGALDYLRHHRRVTAGIYTETTWWDAITGGTSSFSGTPVWGGGANSKLHASENCRAHSITGGPALLAQWIRQGVDHDIAC
jgi:hypothetical protein